MSLSTAYAVSKFFESHITSFLVGMLAGYCNSMKWTGQMLLARPTVVSVCKTSLRWKVAGAIFPCSPLILGPRQDSKRGSEVQNACYMLQVMSTF